MYKILVTVDGSEHSLKTIQESIKRAEPINAEVTLLHVAENFSPNEYIRATKFYGYEKAYNGEEKFRDSFEVVEKVIEDNANNILEEAAQAFAEKSLKVKKIWKKGRPADVICSEAEKGAFDLVIIGNKGFGAFGSYFMGSVANETIHCLKNRVLVIK